LNINIIRAAAPVKGCGPPAFQSSNAAAMSSFRLWSERLFIASTRMLWPPFNGESFYAIFTQARDGTTWQRRRCWHSELKAILTDEIP